MELVKAGLKKKNQTYYKIYFVFLPVRNAYRILVEKPEGKRPLGRPICRWVDNIKIYLKEIG
jgi:hypothetical protein